MAWPPPSWWWWLATNFLNVHGRSITAVGVLFEVHLQKGSQVHGVIFSKGTKFQNPSQQQIAFLWAIFFSIPSLRNPKARGKWMQMEGKWTGQFPCTKWKFDRKSDRVVKLWIATVILEASYSSVNLSGQNQVNNQPGKKSCKKPYGPNMFVVDLPVVFFQDSSRFFPLLVLCVDTHSHHSVTDLRFDQSVQLISGAVGVVQHCVETKWCVPLEGIIDTKISGICRFAAFSFLQTKSPKSKQECKSQPIVFD